MTPESLPPNPKLFDADTLSAALAPLRAGAGLVFTNGCFDLLHAGHVDLLARARALGDLLVLGLNSDASVSRLKGPARPVTPLAERAFVLAGLSSVDFILPFAEDTPYEAIKAVRPDILVKGGDWPLDKIVGRDLVENAGGRVYSLPLLEGCSTTDTINRILRKSGREGNASGGLRTS